MVNITIQEPPSMLSTLTTNTISVFNALYIAHVKHDNDYHV
jgi:hypothetical protein